VEGYAKQMQEEFGVKLVGSIEELCQQVDCVMILASMAATSGAGEACVRCKEAPLHRQALAGSLRDAVEIFRLAKEANVPVFTRLPTATTTACVS
jgi:hypothetical protein